MQDFFKQQAEWLKTWQEQQQTLTKQYAAWGEGLAQGAPGDFSQQVPGNFEELVKAQQELFEQFTGFGQQMQQNLQQLWGDKLPEELLRQFNFNLLQEFYKNWLGNMKFPGGLSNPFMPGQNWTDPTGFLNDFMKNEHPFFSTFSNFNMADEVQKVFGMFGMLQGSKMPGGDLFSQLFTTYQGFFNQLANTGTSKGFDKLLETFNSWKDQSDKYLLAPQVGINREMTQDFSKIISLSLAYFESFAKMGKLIEETARKSGNRFQAKLVERSLNNEPPIKFTDFCNLWTKENEAVFLEVFGSEGFANTQADLASAGLRLKMQIDKLVEKMIDQTPIALKRDVDLAAGEIMQLKRDLRQSRKQQAVLAAECRIAQDAAAASEARFVQIEAALTKAQTLAENAEKTTKEEVAASEKRFKQMEAALAKAQTLAENAEKTAKEEVAAGDKRFKQMEATLTKVQSLAENAEKSAKDAVASPSTSVEAVAAAPKKTAATATKKTPAAAAQKTTKTTAKKASKTTAKKTATTTAKKASGTKKSSGSPTK